MVLHIRKVLKVRIRRILEFVKDRIVIEQVRLQADRRIAPLQVCVICATSHAEQPPSKELVKLILQAGTGSRMRVSQCVNLLMQRLSKTRSWIVALKCLTLIHQALQHGGFIYQDQLLSLRLRLYGGKNQLKFSQFRDRSSPLAWEASLWIRWYAAFLEALIKSFAIMPSTGPLSSLQSDQIMARILSFEALLHEMGRCPPVPDVSQASHVLIINAFWLVVKDYITKHDELRIHMKEMCERLGDLTILQITELLHVHEALNRGSSEAVVKTMNLLHPKAHRDQMILTDELKDTEAALTEALRVSTAAVVTKRASTRKDISLGSVFPVKLLSIGSLKSSDAAWRV